jgi:hypothetical protein
MDYGCARGALALEPSGPFNSRIMKIQTSVVLQIEVFKYRVVADLQ